MTTIENLYYGNIAPHEKHVDPESRLAVLQDLLVSSDEYLTRLLPENCRGAFGAFKSACDEILSISELDSFAQGFRLGIRMGIEIMQEEAE